MIAVFIQSLLPHHLLSRILFFFLRIRKPWLKNWQIHFAIKHFDIDMSQAENSNATSYQHFNDFFTRAIKAKLRPISAPDDNRVYCSPVDGTLNQFGRIDDNQLLQAKGIRYSLTTLLGNQATLAKQFNNGYFLNCYLSPKNYHRIHMPATGQLTDMIYVPGRLFSVANQLVSKLPDLFNRNERVVCLFSTDQGALAVIMIGALFVGCIDTVWHGNVTPFSRPTQSLQYDAKDPLILKKGQEMGRFNMGSSVIVLWEKQCLQWTKSCQIGATLQMGQAIARLIKP